MFFSNERRDWPRRQSFAQQLFDLGQAALVGVAHQGPGPTRRTSTTHTANAVDVVFSVDGQVHHDDVAQAGNVHATSSNVSRDQQLHLFPPKGVDRCRAFGGCHATVSRCGRVALYRNVFDQFFNRLLRGHKNQRLTHVALGQHQIKHFELVLVTVAEHEVVYDGFRDRIRFGQADVRGVFGDGQRQFANGLGQCCRVQTRLALAATGARNALNLLPEANVQHAIGLVDDQRFQPKHGHAVSIQMVDQAARGCDHQIQRTLQGFVLSRIGLPAEHSDSFHLLARENVPRDVPDLLTQLPRGGENDRTRPRSRTLGWQGQARKQRQQEGQSFTRPGGRSGNHVPTAHKRRNGFTLDVCGFLQLHPGHGVQRTHVQPQRFKLG